MNRKNCLLSAIVGLAVLLSDLPAVAQDQPVFQMSPPQVQLDSFFFLQSAVMRLEMDFPGATIHYSLQEDTVTQESPRYRQPIVLQDADTLYARAFHANLQPSPLLQMEAHKITRYVPSPSITAAPQPSEKYAGAGLSVLTDYQKGQLNFSADTEQWLGWEVDTLRLSLTWPMATTINGLSCSFLQNHGAWIFTPQEVRVLHAGAQVGKAVLKVPEREEPTAFRLVHIPLEPGPYTQLKVVIVAARLPIWHPGAGRPAWIFMDEFLTTKTQP